MLAKEMRIQLPGTFCGFYFFYITAVGILQGPDPTSNDFCGLGSVGIRSQICESVTFIQPLQPCAVICQKTSSSCGTGIRELKTQLLCVQEVLSVFI